MLLILSHRRDCGRYLPFLVASILVCNSEAVIAQQQTLPTLFSPPTPSALKNTLGIDKDPKADLPDGPKFLSGERKDRLQKILTDRGVRARVARISVPRLLAVDADLPKNDDGTLSLGLNLFPDVNVTALLRKVDSPSDQTTAWVGTLQDDPVSFVSIVARNDLLLKGDVLARERTTFANVRSSRHGAFEVRPLPDTDSSLIREVDLSRMQPCGTAARHVVEFNAADVPPPVAVDEAVSSFNVLVLYTPDARDTVGGESAMRALIDTAIIETNEAYLQSRVKATVNLAHAAEIDYNEQSTDTFDDLLARLAGKDDGHMDKAHELREEHKADLVALLVENDQYCGLAYLMKTNTPAFRNKAFSVTHTDCATGYFSFGHELGHNMGCCHDEGNHSGSRLFPHSLGWRFDAEGTTYRTIMAYAPGLRIPWFSNPNVEYKGVATGKPDEAENARTINETRSTISSFK